MSTIEINHVTKEYRLGHLTRFKDNLKWGMAKLLGQKASERKPFKALDDINFKVEKGEVIGIIGPNGAGKSTLLKILSSVVQPTQGSIHVEGKVAPLIEVGAGLVGDLTGRENIFLNSSILGIPRSEIKKKMDDIISFAELEEFIDTPIKRYSSGMKVRLGFSIATSIDADILIVDEVLAVGDLAFQRKCFNRMESLIKGENKTVLLVSHNIRQVQRMCSRAILLNNGKIKMDADASNVCTAFYDSSNEKIRQQQNISLNKSRIDSSGEIVLNEISLHNPSEPSKAITETEMHSPLIVKLLINANVDLDGLDCVIGLHTTDFFYLFSASSAYEGKYFSVKKGEQNIEFYFDDLMLMPGVYSFRVAIRDLNGSMILYGENLHPIKITSGNRNISTIPKLGIMDLPYKWSIN